MKAPEKQFSCPGRCTRGWLPPPTPQHFPLVCPCCEGRGLLTRSYVAKRTGLDDVRYLSRIERMTAKPETCISFLRGMPDVWLDNLKGQ